MRDPGAVAVKAPFDALMDAVCPDIFVSSLRPV